MTLSLGVLRLSLAYGTYVEEAVAIGLDIQPMRLSRLRDTNCFADRIMGAQRKRDFIDVLGVPVRRTEAVTAEMLEAKLGHAQAQGRLLRFCAHPRSDPDVTV